MMTTSAFDGNDDARWCMTPDRLVVWSTPHPHLGCHSHDIDDLRRWNHGVNDVITTTMTTTADHDIDYD